MSTSTCAPLSLHHLLSDEIQHAECLSPAGYSTDDRDPGCAPAPLPSAQPHSLAKLALTCAIRYPSRLTTLVQRVAPPRVLSLARIPGSHRYLNRTTSARRLAAIPGRPEDEGGRTCLGRPELLLRRKARGNLPFPPLPTVISARPLIKASAEADSQESGGEPRPRAGCSRLQSGAFFDQATTRVAIPLKYWLARLDSNPHLST